MHVRTEKFLVGIQSGNLLAERQQLYQLSHLCQSPGLIPPDVLLQMSVYLHDNCCVTTKLNNVDGLCRVKPAS